jgi:hypothetical protein
MTISSRDRWVKLSDCSEWTRRRRLSDAHFRSNAQNPTILAKGREDIRRGSQCDCSSYVPGGFSHHTYLLILLAVCPRNILPRPPSPQSRHHSRRAEVKSLEQAWLDKQHHSRDTVRTAVTRQARSCRNPYLIHGKAGSLQRKTCSAMSC